jgi:hypothetical protein
MADEAGKRVVMIDPPESPRVHLRHGFCISGWQFRSNVLMHRYASDPQVAERLERAFGAAPWANEVFGTPEVGRLRQMLEVLLEAPRRMSLLARHFLDHESGLDALWVNCVGLHVAGHQYFDGGMIENVTEFRGALRDLAVRYDRALGEILERLPAGSSTVVFYAKGMSKTFGYPDLVSSMVRRVMGEREASAPRVNWLRELVPVGLRDRVAERLGEDRSVSLTAALASPKLDWSRTRAFALASDLPGFIRFNLKGREREGVVAEGECASLAEELAEGLSTFTHWDGAPCVRAMVSPKELYGEGVKLQQLPDQLVLWDERPTNGAVGVRSERFGEVKRVGVGYGRAGSHGHGAMAMVQGGGMEVDAPEMGAAEDVAATLLTALGVRADGLQGRSWLVGS